MNTSIPVTPILPRRKRGKNELRCFLIIVSKLKALSPAIIKILAKQFGLTPEHFQALIKFYIHHPNLGK